MEGTKPPVYYKNLYRFARCFIGGSIAATVNGVTDCGAGARVVLLKDSGKIDEVASDTFGDFKFDNLEIMHPDHERKTLEVDLRESVNVGTIWL